MRKVMAVLAFVGLAAAIAAKWAIWQPRSAAYSRSDHISFGPVEWSRNHRPARGDRRR
jgi:hypothetical protein